MSSIELGPRDEANNADEINEIDVKYYASPYELIDDFEKSDEYKSMFDQHIKELRLNRPDKDYNDIELLKKIANAFLGSESYIEALHLFWKKNKLSIESVDPKAKEKIIAYWDYIEKVYYPTIEMIRFRAIDREQEIEEFQALSRRRDLVHIEAAKALYGERISQEEESELTNSNLTVGRQLVHLISCDAEKDIPDPNRERGKQTNRRYNDMAADSLFNR